MIHTWLTLLGRSFLFYFIFYDDEQMISHVVSFILIPISIYFTFLPFGASAQTQPVCCIWLQLQATSPSWLWLIDHQPTYTTKKAAYSSTFLVAFAKNSTIGIFMLHSEDSIMAFLNIGPIAMFPRIYSSVCTTPLQVIDYSGIRITLLQVLKKKVN